MEPPGGKRRAQIIAEYVRYIEQLEGGEADRPPGRRRRNDRYHTTETRCCRKAVGEEPYYPPNGRRDLFLGDGEAQAKARRATGQRLTLVLSCVGI